MRTAFVLLATSVLALPSVVGSQSAVRNSQSSVRNPQPSFSISQIKSYPFPSQLTASATGSRIAWTLNEQGRRNIWVAEGPTFAPRRLTSYMNDDGQDLTSVSLSRDGKYVVYLRGGDFGSNFDDAMPVNPAGMPTMPEVQIWSVPFAGGDPVELGEGENPTISPRGDVVAFEKDRQIWVVPIDGSSAARRLFTARGSNGDPRWSPDGTKMAFVSNRGDHAFVGVFVNDSTPIRWIAPTTARDGSPRWSPNGRELVFVRRPGSGGPSDSVLVQRHTPWAIWIGDGTSGQARRLWSSPETLRGSVPTTHGGTNLHWAANDRIVFLSYMDGQPHLYSISTRGGSPLLLTPGPYMAEYISLSADGRTLVFAGNTGPEPNDIDRRHVVKVPVDRAAPVVMTPGAGLEWTPVVTGDGGSVAFISATAQRPPIPAVMPLAGGTPRLIGEDRVPADFPTARLVVPRAVKYRASDGVEVHAQLFDAQPSATGRRPAVVYVHGGPPRQMLLGWHYSDYYTNAYAMNQYLASRGYLVLVINYRLGIGYGYEFHRPRNAGAQGASEYLDVKAAGEYLRTLPNVDPRRIGIYGGSYGGFLTALALARDSDLFAAGVDIHGVHDWTTERARGLMNRERFEEPPDLPRALETAWRSSPVSSIATWKSPVLLIHGDDDRNVRFSQTVDLVQRLTRAGVPFEEIVIPDDTHHWMRHENAVAVNAATAEFFDRKLRGNAVRAEGSR
ncbi:MAG TPA: prolyl oligopeptidase family serine peptidase [Gemmatimonadaceae bacterium]|nr:prolyl oligopeptidase family serine peptidase [Gemmatimonadaceae bacterium]